MKIKFLQLLTALVISLGVFFGAQLEPPGAAAASVLTQTDSYLCANNQADVIQQVTPVETVDSVLLSNKISAIGHPLLTPEEGVEAAVFWQTDHDLAETPETYYAAIRGRPKLGFNGVGANRFARADI